VVKEDEANEQHKSIIQVEALKAAALEWTFEQINFVARRRGAVVEDDFYNKRERLNVQERKKYKILAEHVQRICEAHDTVMRSYYQQIHKKKMGHLGLT
jgi:UTP-glucose-1-phosphate uridylyltransferase